MGDDRRIIQWVDLVADLLQRPRPEFPHDEVGRALSQTFELNAVSLFWRGPGGASFQIWPDLDLTPVADLPAWEQDETMDRHPLIRWHCVTQSSTPQTIGRVPTSISPLRDRQVTDAYVKPLGLDQQMSIPLLVHGTSSGVFALGRSADDFCDGDLDVACHLQGLIRGLYLRAAPVARGPAGSASCRAAAAAGLTATEIAVLALLTEGHTAHGIGMRLSMSPRTAHKHLEHIYRKLGVNDRLAAAFVAREAGILMAPGPEGHEAHPPLPVKDSEGNTHPTE